MHGNGRKMLFVKEKKIMKSILTKNQKKIFTKNIVSVLNGNFFAKTKEDDDEQKRIKEMLSRDVIESVSKELLKIKEQGFFYI